MWCVLKSQYAQDDLNDMNFNNGLCHLLMRIQLLYEDTQTVYLFIYILESYVHNEKAVIHFNLSFQISHFTGTAVCSLLTDQNNLLIFTDLRPDIGQDYSSVGTHVRELLL